MKKAPKADASGALNASSFKRAGLWRFCFLRFFLFQLLFLSFVGLLGGGCVVASRCWRGGLLGLSGRRCGRGRCLRRGRERQGQRGSRDKRHQKFVHGFKVLKTTRLLSHPKLLSCLRTELIA